MTEEMERQKPFILYMEATRSVWNSFRYAQYFSIFLDVYAGRLVKCWSVFSFLSLIFDRYILVSPVHTEQISWKRVRIERVGAQITRLIRMLLSTYFKIKEPE
jgi:hypothetical protein